MIDFEALRHYLPVFLLAVAQILQTGIIFYLNAQLRELRQRVL